MSAVSSALDRTRASLDRLVGTPGVLAAFAVLAALALLTVHGFRDFQRRSDALEHSYAARAEIDGLRALYDRVRFHWRYYFITGNAEWLAEFRHAAGSLSPRLAGLRELYDGDAPQTERLARLEKLLLEDRDTIDRLASRKAAGAYRRSDEMLATIEEVQPAISAASLLFGELTQQESARLERLKGDSAQSERVLTWLVLGGNAAALLLLGSAFLVLRGEIRRRRRSQAESERLAAQLEDLYNNAPCGYHSVDANGLIVRMNDTWLRWLGYSRDEVVGKLHHPDLMTVESARRFRDEAFPLFKKQGWLKEVEFEYVRKDGTTFPGSLQTSTIYDAAGRYLMSRTTVFDISSRKRLERELRESHAFLDSVVENIPNMVFVKDAAELRFVRLNRAGEELLGMGRQELIGRRDHDLFPAPEADFFAGKDREVLAGGRLVEIEGEEIATRGKGRRVLHTKKLPLLDAGGRPKYLLGISEDITEKRQAQAAIEALNAALAARARELEAVNKELESFSYSVSHDLRAPLRAVDGYARMIEEDYAERLDAEGRRLLSVVRASSRQMGQLIDDLLAFSRLGRQEMAAGRLDMDRLVAEVATELRERYPAARLEVAPLPPARGDRALLRQVWTNLIGNALKYSAKQPQPLVEISGELRDGQALYRVSDNGVGFDMRYADKLFGVFQRLHRAEEFEGTGVGLAIVKRVVARHGGRVDARSTPGQGATFSFSLPLEARDD